MSYKKLSIWDDCVKRALRAYTKREQYCYIYGAKNVMIHTRQDVEYYFQVSPDYFSRYSLEEKEQIIRNSIGKIACDCSGFVGWICTGDKQYSTGQFENCSFKTADLSAGVAGSGLYTTYKGKGRHIGIDIGYGYCCDMAYESTNENIKNGKAGIRLYKILDNITEWEWSFQSRLVDYTGATSR